jgi:hypothetical protein
MDYVKLVTDTLQEIRRLREEYFRIGDELSKRIQFVSATMPLLPNEEQERLQRDYREYKTEWDARGTGDGSLTRAIRRVLRNAARGEPLTVAEVRDKLQATGFDFSNYKSNPLAAISTTLKRMGERDEGNFKEGAIRAEKLDGVAIYSMYVPDKKRKRARKK